MTQLFGDFNDELIDRGEYLELRFLPNSMPLKQRWRNNGLSADFLSDYLTTFFPSNEIDKKAEIKGTVNYIANELLENAMKFNDEPSNYPITIKLLLMDKHIIFNLINSMPFKDLSKFQAYLRKLSTSNTQELYVKQLEHNAKDENWTTSGLGILTMINDYMAKVGWRLEVRDLEPKLVIVTTLVKLSV